LVRKDKYIYLLVEISQRVFMSRLIGVISAKGGVGKTTVVSNLSVALAKVFHKRVTVVDCNITTSHLSLHFGAYSHPITLNTS